MVGHARVGSYPDHPNNNFDGINSHGDLVNGTKALNNATASSQHSNPELGKATAQARTTVPSDHGGPDTVAQAFVPARTETAPQPYQPAGAQYRKNALHLVQRAYEPESGQFDMQRRRDILRTRQLQKKPQHYANQFRMGSIAPQAMSAHVDFQQQYADITQSSKTDIPALSQGPSNEVKQYQKKSYESFDKCYIYA